MDALDASFVINDISVINSKLTKLVLNFCKSKVKINKIRWNRMKSNETVEK